VIFKSVPCSNQEPCPLAQRLWDPEAALGEAQAKNVIPNPKGDEYP